MASCGRCRRPVGLSAPKACDLYGETSPPQPAAPRINTCCSRLELALGRRRPAGLPKCQNRSSHGAGGLEEIGGGLERQGPSSVARGVLGKGAKPPRENHRTPRSADPEIGRPLCQNGLDGSGTSRPSVSELRSRRPPKNKPNHQKRLAHASDAVARHGGRWREP